MIIVIDTKRIASSLRHGLGAIHQATKTGAKKLRHPAKSIEQWKLDRNWEKEAQASWLQRRMKGEP